ncbi:MAG: DNA polymerase domain-containing protein [Thermofilaceae archaeon]
MRSVCAGWRGLRVAGAARFLLEVEVSGDRAKLWFKDFDGGVEVEGAEFKPYFLAMMDLDSSLAQTLLEAGFELERVSRKLFPSGEAELTRVEHSSVRALAKARLLLERSGITLYDVDVRSEQKLLASRRLLALTPQLEDCEARFEPLPLTVLSLKVRESTAGLKVLAGLEGRVRRLKGGDARVAKGLAELVESFDPDVISSNVSVGELAGIASRLLRAWEGFKLGRGSLMGGRILVSEGVLEQVGLEGLEERCWFSGLPPTLAAGTSYGLLVEARQTYLLLSRGYAVPKRGNGNFVLRPANLLHARDKGGLIKRPIVGVYENVAELDFESMFPGLIVKHNISYETVTHESVAPEPRGLLVDVVEPVLRRRLMLKRLRDQLSGGDRLHAELRQRELKMLLVSCYGYSGNSRNRLGNPLTFEWINRLARETLIRVYEHVESRGYRVVYGDTDSVFVQKSGAKPSEYAELAGELAALTGLPVKLERIYKFIAFPAARSLPGAPLKRYFGVTLEGELVFKGVEAARRDTPPAAKRLQRELVATLFRAESLEGVYANLEAAIRLACEYVAKARRGELEPADLVIERVLRKREYKTTPAHLAAAVLAGRVVEGATVHYVPVNTRHPNPLRRVRPWSPSEKRYDAEYASELLSRAAETVLSALGAKPDWKRHAPLYVQLDYSEMHPS